MSLDKWYKLKESQKAYCLDTNIPLDNPSNILKLYDNGNILLLPEVVIDELDAKKSGFEEINYNARQFARFLEESEILGKYEENGLLYIKTRIESLGVELYIVSKQEYRCESTKVALNILNDRKILEVASDASVIFKDLIFISLDIMARTRALSLGIETETLKGKDQKLEFEFHKTIIVDDVKSIKDGTKIADIDIEYKPENYSYTLEDKDSGQQRLFYIQNDHLFEVDESMLEKQSVKPINKEQKFFSNAILEDHANIIIVDAKAGSGKTLLALSAAIRLVKLKKYSKILYVRDSIESVDKGSEVGFLPGLAEKFAIYNHALYDSLKYIARSEIKKSKANTPKSRADAKEQEELITEKVDGYIKEYNIETGWPGEMRGRTFSDTIIIMDECQNMSGKTALLVISRIDKTCKLIAIGSNKQIDNMYTNKFINGLSTLMKASKEKHPEVTLFAGELNKVVRGPITEWAERIFEQK